MHEYLLDFVGGNRLLAGFICLLIVLILLKYQIYLKKKYNPKLWSPYGMIDWKKYVSIWVIISILLIYSYSLFFW
jgi:hypothetical protein